MENVTAYSLEEVTDVSEEHCASIFMAEKKASQAKLHLLDK
jgi:hypothetical protein